MNCRIPVQARESGEKSVTNFLMQVRWSHKSTKSGDKGVGRKKGRGREEVKGKEEKRKGLG